MRDIVVIGGILISLPFCFFRPHLGILVWILVSLANPHRMTYGPAYSFPVAQLVAICTLGGFLIHRRKARFPWTMETALLLILFLWFTLTTFVALNPDGARQEWDRFGKTYLMVGASLFLFQDRQRLRLFFLTIGISVAVFGVKGAFFAMRTGGEYIVFGPPGSFIEDNNALALAELMVLPILAAMAPLEKKWWVKWGLYATAALSVFAVVFSYSRGALLAMGGLGVAALAFSRHRWRYIGFAVLFVLVVFPVIPEKWHERMSTIGTYQEDRSAMGRVNAWHFAFNLASERPLTGGGFRSFTNDLFIRYAPDPFDVHDAHSIYFEVLGEHGFLALALFILLLVGSIFQLRSLKARIRKRPEFAWAEAYATMLQLSLTAYTIGGAFLGLAYFDLLYYLIAASVCLQATVRREIRQEQIRAAEPVPWEEGPPALARAAT
jgi:probable O-glycosylation ligase (exosortase A-associated)